MVASSSTFRPPPPPPGRVIRDLFGMLHDVRHATEALVYSNYLREAAVSTCLTTIFRRIASRMSWFLSSTAVLMQLPHRCRHLQWHCTGTDVGRCGAKQPAIECLTLCILRGMDGITLSYCYIL